MAVTAPAPPVGATATNHVKIPAGIETSTAFNTWLSTVPNGSVVNLIGATIDAEEGPVMVDGRQDLVFLGGTVTQRTDGTGVTPKTWAPRLHLVWPRHRCGWYVANSSRIAWYGTTFTGPNTLPVWRGQSYEEQAAWSLRRCSDIDLAGITATGPWGDAVSIVHDDNDGTRSPCERVRINGATFRNVGRNFVSVVCGIDVLISGVVGDGSARSGFNIEPAVEANRVERVEIRNVSVSRVTGVVIAHKGASNRVSDIAWRDIRSVDKPISVTITGRLDRPGRRSGYLLERLTGGGSGIANGVPFGIDNVDNVEIRDVWQRCAGFRPPSGGSRTGYPGVGINLSGVNNVRVERAEFPKGHSEADTGDVTPVKTTNCTGVVIV